MSSALLEPEHVAIRDAVRTFVARKVTPTAAARERADEYPADLLPALADLGVLGMTIPAELGGSGLDLVAFALVFEELACGWMGLASVVGSSASGTWLIARYGTDAQRARYLTDLAGGRRMSGIALTEAGAGSDLKAIKLAAVHGDGNYVVSGTKTMITQAAHADPLLVLAVTDPAASPPHRGMSLLAVERDTPGCSVTSTIGKLGHRGVELCEVTFDSARVPTGNLLGGEEGRGLSQMLSALDRGRIYMAASSVGSPAPRSSRRCATRSSARRSASRSPSIRRSSSNWPTWRSASRPRGR